MESRKSGPAAKTVATLTHPDDKRRLIPTADHHNILLARARQRIQQAVAAAQSDKAEAKA